MKVAFTSIAFGDRRYLQQLEKCAASIAEHHPEARLFSWVNEFPSRPHTESLYGFKPHCVKTAADAGFRFVVWLDPACYLTRRIDDVIELSSQHGVVAIRDENKLRNGNGQSDFIAPDCVAKYGVPQSELARIHLVGGSLYVFDFEHPKCNEVFNDWLNMEVSGMFHCPSHAGHRNDESCMAVAMWRAGIGPIDPSTGCYRVGSGVEKAHFK